VIREWTCWKIGQEKLAKNYSPVIKRLFTRTIVVVAVIFWSLKAAGFNRGLGLGRHSTFIW
jgi:hypothetical protein